MPRTTSETLRAIVSNLTMAAQGTEHAAEKAQALTGMKASLDAITALSKANAFRESIALVRSEAGACEHGVCNLDHCDHCEHG